MAPLTKDQRNALLRSGLALLAVVAGVFVLLLLNKPPEKPVKFNAVCRSFVAPADLTLKLHEGGGEVQEMVADGFNAVVANVESAAFIVEGVAAGEVRAQRFTLDRRMDVNETPPHLDATPSGGLGRAELVVSSGAVVSSFGSAESRPWVRASSADGKGLQLTVVSPVSVLKGNRYTVGGVTLPKLPKRMVESLQAEVKGAIPGAMVSLTSGAPGSAIKVLFREGTGDVPLYQRVPDGVSEAQAPPGGEVSHVPLVLQGCVNPDLRIGDKTATGVIADRSTDLTIKAISGTIDEVSITGAAEKNDAPRLRVRGRAQASSLQQDEHELLPTRVGEAMDLPYAERGVALILLGFVLFLAFKVVDRTLGVLLEYLFPKVGP
jgi:hypothetical protein